MKKNNIFSVFIIFMVTTLQLVQLKGQIKADTLLGTIGDAKTLLAVSKSTILLRSKLDSSIVNYALSNTDGTFSIWLKSKQWSNLYLEIKHLSYQTKIVNLDTSLELRLHLYLFPKEHTIQEVVIKGKQPIKAKQDTVVYNVNEYIDSSEITVAELLSKLPGVDVNDRGDVKVHGKEIVKILIDGEDLADKNYQILSNNLKADLVEKVEVFFNHIENQLLIDFFRTDNIAINLVLKNDKKRKANISIIAGAGTNKRFDVDVNLVALYDRLKGISIVQNSNIGRPMQYINNFEPYIGDFKESFLTGRSIDQLANYSVSYSKKDIKRINNVEFISNRIAFNPGKNWSLRLSADLPKERLNYKLSNSYIFNNKSIDDYTDFIESHILMKQSKVQIDGVVNFNAKSRLKFNSSYGFFSEENKYEIFRRERNLVEILSRGLLTHLDYSYKWNDNIISILSYDVSDMRQIHGLSFENTGSSQIYFFDNELMPKSQFRTLESNSSILGLKTLIKTKKQPLYIGVYYVNKNNEYVQENNYQDSSFLFLKPIYQDEVRLDLNYTHALKKGKITFLIQPGSIFLKSFNEIEDRKAVSYVSRKNYVQFGLEYKENPKNGASMAYRYSYLSDAFNIFKYITIDYLENRYRIRRGYENLIINSGHNLNLSFKKNLNYPYFLFYSDFHIRYNKRQDADNYFFNNDFILSTWDQQRQNEITFNSSLGLEKLLDRVSLTVKAKPNFFYQKYINYFEKEKRINHNYFYGFGSSITSGWEIPINFSLGHEFNINSTVIDRRTVKTRLVAMNSVTYFDLRIDISSRFRVKTSNSFNSYNDRGNNDFKYLITDFDANYNFKDNKLKFKLSINNLFNVKQVTSLNSSDYLQVVTNTVVLPQYYLLTIQYTL